jgi:hypothetical protein
LSCSPWWRGGHPGVGVADGRLQGCDPRSSPRVDLVSSGAPIWYHLSYLFLCCLPHGPSLYPSLILSLSLEDAASNRRPVHGPRGTDCPHWEKPEAPSAETTVVLELLSPRRIFLYSQVCLFLSLPN